jgi:AraC family transcriptional regulator
MEPRIVNLPETKLIGISMKMTLAQNKTAELWRQFMPQREEVNNRANSKFVSMQVFESAQADPFSLETPFEKWAAVEVTDQDIVPQGMQPYTIAGGKYAVFTHRGPASDALKTFHYIFRVWLPESGFELDSREHFEQLPPGYRPDDPLAEEEVWIPIK